MGTSRQHNRHQTRRHHCLCLMAVGLLAFFWLPQRATAQEVSCNSSTQGTDFWVMFLSNINPTPVLKLIAATNAPSEIHVYNHLMQWDTVVSAAAHSTVEIPISAENGATFGNNTIYDKALHVVSSHPISLYASNYLAASYDIATVLPSGALGSQYIAQCYFDNSSPPEVGLAAMYDSTVITLHNYPTNGQNSEVTLMRGQSVQYNGTNLQGILITSNDKPFALFQGNPCTIIGNCGACDHLYEQALPVKLWGKNFLLVSTAERPSGDQVLITSSEDSCFLSIDNTTITVLNQGQNHTYELPYNEVHMLTATKPVYTCIYLKGLNCGNTIGDPASVTVPPIEQSVNSITFQAITTILTDLHYANIVTRTANLPFMMLDSIPIGDEFSPLTNGYSYLRKPISNGVHTLENEHGGFLAHFYGLGMAESYAYIAGMATFNLNYSLLADSVNVRTHSDQFVYCLGDTVHYNLQYDDDTIDIVWRVDSMAVAYGSRSFDYTLDSPGWHLIEGIVNDCDTLSSTLYVRPKRTDTIEVVRCMTEGFTFGDSLYLASCDIVTPFVDTNGCPADTMFHLTIIPTAHSFESDSICFNGNYVWHGMTYDTAGIYYDTLSTVADGCDSVVQLTLYTIPKPPTGIDWVSDCHENHYTLTAVLDESQSLPFQWSSVPHDPLLDGHEEDTVLFAVPATWTLYSLAFDYRCPYNDTATLRPIEWPHADFVVTPERMTYDQPFVDAHDRSKNINHRQWYVDMVPQFESGVHFHYDAAEGIDSVVISLVVGNINCDDTLHRTIPFVRTGCWAPNVFMPTSEYSDNKTFGITLLGGAAEELYIYNRQGMLVFHSQGPDPQWDGKCNGVLCPQGTYVWTLRFHYDYQPERIQTLTGSVTLLR